MQHISCIWSGWNYSVRRGIAICRCNMSHFVFGQAGILLWGGVCPTLFSVPKMSCFFRPYPSSLLLLLIKFVQVTTIINARCAVGYTTVVVKSCRRVVSPNACFAPGFVRCLRSVRIWNKPLAYEHNKMRYSRAVPGGGLMSKLSWRHDTVMRWRLGAQKNTLILPGIYFA